MLLELKNLSFPRDFPLAVVVVEAATGVDPLVLLMIILLLPLLLLFSGCCWKNVVMRGCPDTGALGMPLELFSKYITYHNHTIINHCNGIIVEKTIVS